MRSELRYGAAVRPSTVFKPGEPGDYQKLVDAVQESGGKPVELRLTNCAESAYPHGWDDYRARMSYDREYWEQVETSYDGGILTIKATQHEAVKVFEQV